MALLMNFQNIWRRINTSVYQIILKYWKGGSTSQFILPDQYYLDTKARSWHYKKKKKKENKFISQYPWLTYIQKSFKNKLETNLRTHWREHTPWSSQICLWGVRKVQLKSINLTHHIFFKENFFNWSIADLQYYGISGL